MKRILVLIITALIITTSAYTQVRYDDGAVGGANFAGNCTWGRSNISFSFYNGTNDIPNNDERIAIRQAFQLWADYGNVNFTEVASGGDILVLWGMGNHGDPYPFDGQNGVLAHASYPCNGGDVHFDDDETWSLLPQAGGAQPMDLVTVAAHEIGHALGLGHSNLPCSLMGAYYTGSHRYLSQDEVNGIRSLYGFRTAIRTTGLTCSGGVFSIVNLPVGATVNWTSSNLSVASVANNSNQGTVTRVGSGNGTVRITGTITLPCGTTIVEFMDIYIGVPTITTNNPLKYWYGNPSTDYNDVCNLQTFYTNMQVNGATSVHWTRTAASPTNTNWSQSGNNINFYFWAIGQTAIFKITVANSCGSISYSFGFRSINCGGGGGCERYVITPNPASGSASIAIPKIPPPCLQSTSPADISQHSINEVKIYDNTGMLKQTLKQTGAKQVNINLAGFKAGIYILEISDGEYKERQQLVVVN